MSTEPDRDITITHDTTHVAEGVAALYRQFTKPIITAWITAYLEQAQSIEDVLWDLLSQTLDDAVGVFLDQIGVLLGLGRGALDDTSYRAVLRSIVLARRSTGSPESLIAVAAAALGVVSFDYREGHASVLISPHAPIAFGPALKFVLMIAKNAGIALQLLTPAAADSATFTFSASGFAASTDASRGFSDTTQVAGGELAGVL